MLTIYINPHSYLGEVEVAMINSMIWEMCGIAEQIRKESLPK